MKICEVTPQKYIVSPFETTEDGDNLMRTLENSCSQALHALSDDRIMLRGATLPTFNAIHLVNPAAKLRVSRFTSNYYTLMLDNLPAWNGWPKRSQSIICTTSIHKASNYGIAKYLVLPMNGARIGVCPEADIWNSFHRKFNTLYSRLVAPLKKQSITDKSYSAMMAEIFKYKKWLLDTFPELASTKNVRAVVGMFDTALNPGTNGFAISDINNIPYVGYGSGVELWTDSQCYMIEINSYFFNKYINYWLSDRVRGILES